VIATQGAGRIHADAGAIANAYVMITKTTLPASKNHRCPMGTVWLPNAWTAGDSTANRMMTAIRSR